MILTTKNIEPEVCEYVDSEDRILMIEVVLPDVTKENIRLRIDIKSLLLIARCGDKSYVKTLTINQPIIPEKGRATLDHGLLRIKIPLRA